MEKLYCIKLSIDEMIAICNIIKILKKQILNNIYSDIITDVLNNLNSARNKIQDILFSDNPEFKDILDG